MTSALPVAPDAGDSARRIGVAAWAPALITAGYLAGAFALTWRLWAHPGSAMVAGNTTDTDLFAWFLRYDATAIAHGRLPALVTTAMNAPIGINLMWNTSLLVPGILLTPVTLLAGPQASLTVLVTAGFAGSAASMFYMLRRWQVSRPAAALGGAVYGFSPALLHSAVGHYNLQLAVLPPLIVEAALRPALGSSASPWRTGLRLGLLITAQLFISEEVLLGTAIVAVLAGAVLAASRPRAAVACAAAIARVVAVAAAVILALAGWALRTQFFGPLTEHGSAFLPNFYENDLTGFVTPSAAQLLHTGSSAAAAARYQGGLPEYLAYLGIPMLALLACAAVAFWRRLAVRAAAAAFVVPELLSLGGHPLIDGTEHYGVWLPWAWISHLPLIAAALPDRLSIVADGAAAALLAFSIDLTRVRLGSGTKAAGLAAALAALAVAPLLPVPLPAAFAAPLPPGWTTAFGALRLPPDARVLVIPVPTAMATQALRWQAESGTRIALIGGYFQGPAGNGQAYVEGGGLPALTGYLDQLYEGNGAAQPPGIPQALATMRAWDPAAVVAVAGQRSALRRYLVKLLGLPSLTTGAILVWRSLVAVG